MTTSPSIIIRDASLTYDDIPIFENLTCSIDASEFTCLLGPSGVGKSTLLHMIAGICNDNCSIDVTKIGTDTGLDLQNNIAYMGQTDLLMPWLNTLDNALLNARLNQKITKNKKQQAINLLNQVGLGSALKKYPAELSGGMRQRVALVRTLLQDKPIILMDEPFSALDAITRLKLQELAAKLLKNKTVLLVTHDPLEALRLGNKIYVMSGQPATLSTPIIPEGAIPRSLNDAKILKLQGELLQQLETAQEFAA